MKLAGYRKLLVFGVILVIATALLIWGKLSGAEWVDAIKWVAGLYFTANAASKATENVAVTLSARRNNVTNVGHDSNG